MDLQEASDRVEITELLARYSNAIDTGEWDNLDEVFTPDAHIDYVETGGIAGSYPEIKQFLKDALPMFPQRQHQAATTVLHFDAADRAHGRTMCMNPLVFPEKLPDGSVRHRVMKYGIWYVDEFVRTPAGWRMSSRAEELVWTDNLAPGFSGV